MVGPEVMSIHTKHVQVPDKEAQFQSVKVCPSPSKRSPHILWRAHLGFGLKFKGKVYTLDMSMVLSVLIRVLVWEMFSDNE